MDPFVIQPTYALHSLLFPNRSIDMAAPGVDQVRSDREADPHAVDHHQAHRELCDA